MDLKLTFLGRAANRWRVRVDLPCGFRPRGLTVGLWGEDDKPLGPAVVAPADVGGSWEAEVAGPCPLPPGTLVRCMADREDGSPVVYWLGVDPRRGLHAFLHADARLPVESSCQGAALSTREIDRLAGAFPWVHGERSEGKGLECPDDIPPELREMLRDEFGVEFEDS